MLSLLTCKRGMILVSAPTRRAAQKVVFSLYPQSRRMNPATSIEVERCFSTDYDPHYSVFSKGERPRIDRNLEEEWRKLNAQSRPQDAATQETEILRKRLRYAATKRGWVETQEMLVPFVEAHLSDMSREDLLDFDRLLQCDDWFLMQIIAKTRDTPPELQCRVLEELQEVQQVET